MSPRYGLVWWGGGNFGRVSPQAGGNLVAKWDLPGLGSTPRRGPFNLARADLVEKALGWKIGYRSALGLR